MTPVQIAELLETVMIFCFGLSWPMNLINSIKSKTAKGKSLSFYYLIFFGYIAGICAKIIVKNFFTLPSIFYVLNLVMVGSCIIVYYYNKKVFDKEWYFYSSSAYSFHSPKFINSMKLAYKKVP